MGNEKFMRALKAMKPLGLSSNDVSPVLKRLLKVYDNEWPLIEEESYRVLADAVFEWREEQAKVELKRKEGKRRGKQTVEDSDDDHCDTESEYECEYEFVPPLTRARSVLVNKPKNEEILEVEEGFDGGIGVPIEEEGAEAPPSPPRRSSRLRIASFSSSASASATSQKGGSRLENENEIEGRGKRIACEPPPLALPPATSVLKKPKIEVNEDLERDNYVGCSGTPIVEEIDESSKGVYDCQTSGALKKPKIERDGCTFPFTVMNVVPITAVNVCPEPSSDQNENSSDLEELQTDKKGCEVQGCSVPFSSSLGAIAEAYMEMDVEEIPSTEFRRKKLETRLTIFNSKDNVQGESQSSLDHSNGFQGSGHMQSCTEYSICIDGSVHTPARLEYNNSLKGSDLAERNLDHNSGNSGLNIPQPSIDMVLKMVEGYTLQSFKVLAPDFPVMRLMEKFCQNILNSRNDGLCDEKQTEIISMVPNLLTSGNETKVRRSPRIKPKTQETSIPDKGKVNAETKDHASSSTMLISLEPCQPSVEQSRSVHDLMDISRGEENIQISITNELTSESYPPAFYYIPKSIVYQNAYINISLARIGDDDCCSDCSSNCLESPITCACARETGGEYAYTRDGVLKKDFLEEALSIHMKPKPHHYFYCRDCPQERTKNEYKPDSCKGHLIRKFIKECWSKCSCSKHCGNRVVQRGINRKLQVFFTSEGKGWGVRTLEDIPRGAFVCEYVGEILTNTELYNRNNERMGNEKHTYPVLLDADWCSEGVLKDEDALCLDATHYGNVARFINHRCYDANLMEIPVEVESPDRHYYHLAFFTTRKVEALEELTWFGTSVGSGALTLSQSAAFAFLMEVLGATIMGNPTVDILQSDILKERPTAPLLMWGFMIAIIAATIWLAIATYLKIPVSSFLSIKGAIIGISITTEGLHSIYWKKFDSSSALKVGGVVSIVLSWIIAPLIAGVAAFILFSFTRLVLLRSKAARQRVLCALPFYYGSTVMVLVLFFIYRGSTHKNFHSMRFGKASAIAGLSGILAALLVFIRFKVVPLSQKLYGNKDIVVGENPQKEDPPLPSPSESQPDNQEADSTHQELNAEEILRQFQDLRVLDTVYEVDEEEEADESPPSLVKCSSFLAGPRVPLRQLLAQRSAMTSFSRLRKKRKLSTQQKISRLLRTFSALTFRHKIQYNQNTLVRHALAETFDINAERLFCFLQILIAGAFSFSHGSNELSNLLNPYFATVKIYRGQQLVDKHANVWILAMGGFAASIGFAAVGWRLVRCFGGHITYMTPSRGFIAQFSALMTVLIADKTGLPLATEHIIIGAILGVGTADNIQNVHWKLVITFMLMWIATLIFTCGICAALYAFTIYSPAYVVE